MDRSLQQVKKLTMERWPGNINNIHESRHKKYWKVHDQLHVLQAIHEGHMGIERCKQHGRARVYWPSMNDDIERHTKECEMSNLQQISNY